MCHLKGQGTSALYQCLGYTRLAMRVDRPIEVSGACMMVAFDQEYELEHRHILHSRYGSELKTGHCRTENDVLQIIIYIYSSIHCTVYNISGPPPHVRLCQSGRRVHAACPPSWIYQTVWDSQQYDKQGT